MLLGLSIRDGHDLVLFLLLADRLLFLVHRGGRRRRRFAFLALTFPSFQVSVEQVPIGLVLLLLLHLLYYFLFRPQQGFFSHRCHRDCDLFLCIFRARHDCFGAKVRFSTILRIAFGMFFYFLVLPFCLQRQSFLRL